MAWEGYAQFDTAQTLYAKPRSLTEPWEVDVVTMSEAGSTGEYVVGGLGDGITYAVFHQRGAAPALDDPWVGDMVPDFTLDIPKYGDKVRRDIELFHQTNNDYVGYTCTQTKQ